MMWLGPVSSFVREAVASVRAEFPRLLGNRCGTLFLQTRGFLVSGPEGGEIHQAMVGSKHAACMERNRKRGDHSHAWDEPSASREKPCQSFRGKKIRQDVIRKS